MDRSRSRLPRQNGATLLVVMVLVLVLMLGALAALRSSETSALVAGNTAFREATKQASDLGIVAAFAYVDGMTAQETSVANRYFPLRQAEDQYGMPSTVDWNAVAVIDVQAMYKVQYVVERLCSGTIPVTDPVNNCVTDSQSAPGSNKLGSEMFSLPSTTVFRVTVRARGPKNAESYTQALISR
jgi:type IV pilus assembly protein PilX